MAPLKMFSFVSVKLESVLSQYEYKQNNQSFLSLPVVLPLRRILSIGGNVSWNCSMANPVDTAGINRETGCMANQFTIWT